MEPTNNCIYTLLGAERPDRVLRIIRKNNLSEEAIQQEAWDLMQEIMKINEVEPEKECHCKKCSNLHKKTIPILNEILKKRGLPTIKEHENQQDMDEPEGLNDTDTEDLKYICRKNNGKEEYVYNVNWEKIEEIMENENTDNPTALNKLAKPIITENWTDDIKKAEGIPLIVATMLAGHTFTDTEEPDDGYYIKAAE